MATPTYDLLESVTLATAASSVTFSSIDQSYGDLILETNCKGVGGTKTVVLRFNSDGGSNYRHVVMGGTGSSTGSVSGPNDQMSVSGFYSFDDGTVSQITSSSFFDYSSTDKHKTVLSRSSVGSGANPGVSASAAIWSNTAAINSILVGTGSRDWAAGSTFNLYGVAK